MFGVAKLHEFRGQQLTAQQIAAQLNVGVWLVRDRIRRGLPIDKPSRKNKTPSNAPKYSCKGEIHTLSEWAKITGISAATLHERIKQNGWSIERALITPITPFRQCNASRINKRVIARITASFHAEPPSITTHTPPAPLSAINCTNTGG